MRAGAVGVGPQLAHRHFFKFCGRAAQHLHQHHTRPVAGQAVLRGPVQPALVPEEATGHAGAGHIHLDRVVGMRRPRAQQVIGVIKTQVVRGAQVHIGQRQPVALFPEKQRRIGHRDIADQGGQGLPLAVGIDFVQHAFAPRAGLGQAQALAVDLDHQRKRGVRATAHGQRHALVDAARGVQVQPLDPADAGALVKVLAVQAALVARSGHRVGPIATAVGVVQPVHGRLAIGAEQLADRGIDHADEPLLAQPAGALAVEPEAPLALQPVQPQRGQARCPARRLQGQVGGQPGVQGLAHAQAVVNAGLAQQARQRCGQLADGLAVAGRRRDVQPAHPAPALAGLVGLPQHQCNALAGGDGLQQRVVIDRQRLAVAAAQIPAHGRCGHPLVGPGQRAVQAQHHLGVGRCAC